MNELVLSDKNFKEKYTNQNIKNNLLQLLVIISILIVPYIVFIYDTNLHFDIILNAIKNLNNLTEITNILNGAKNSILLVLFTDFLMYTILQLLNYVLFIFKSKKGLVITLIIELIITIIVFTEASTQTFIVLTSMFVIPLISSLSYYLILKKKY